MPTQGELREAVSYSDIQQVAKALTPDRTYGNVSKWRESWASDTMHALGWYMADLMRKAGVGKWQCDGFTFYVYPARDATAVVVSDVDGSTASMIYGSHRYQGPRRFYAGQFADGTTYEADPEMIEDWAHTTACAALYPDVAFLCDNCDGPHWHGSAFEPRDTGDGVDEVACVHCGALGMQGVVCDCAHFGRDTCQHHGARLVPMNLVIKHDDDVEAASAEYLEDDRAHRVARQAAKHDGIWSFPNGKLAAGLEAGS